MKQPHEMTDRELDAAVASEVIGFGDRVKMWGDQPVIADAYPVSVPHYSSDHNEMAAVIATMRDSGWFVTMADCSPHRSGRGERRGKYYARFFVRRKDPYSSLNEHLPRAVSEAAILAVRAEKETPRAS